jgi:hypothetical protein
MIDSGAAICMFHSDVANAIGLKIAQGELSETIGISGAKTAIYLHNVSLYVPGGYMFKIRAGFTNELPIAGVLGRIGFFEHFKITFDPSYFREIEASSSGIFRLAFTSRKQVRIGW